MLTSFQVTGLPWWLSWRRICLQCGRPVFEPWVGNIPEEEKAIHSSILAWKIPWTIQSMGSKESDMTKQLSLSVITYYDEHLLNIIDVKILLCISNDNPIFLLIIAC